MYKLIIKNNSLFAVSRFGAAQQFEGKIINTTSGECIDNPDFEEPGVFNRIFEGHGQVFHLSENPINPFYIRARELFCNPEMLPKDSHNIFLDVSQSAFHDFEAELVIS